MCVLIIWLINWQILTMFSSVLSTPAMEGNFLTYLSMIVSLIGRVVLQILPDLACHP